MSLRVWLPLTKDLRNQGLNSVTIEEVTSTVFDNGGKLGKCLSGGKIKIPANQVASIFNNTSMSIAFWYNNNTSETTGNHAICGFFGNGEGDTDAVRIWDFFNYADPNTFHWSMGTLGGGSLSNIFPANTWVHVCVTWNAPTLKIYMDGVLKYTGSGSSNYTFNKSYYISFGRTPQKLNDFRIYDHCLSPMEVKEIAKGLILHYPLNRQGWGQENLVWDTHWDETSTKWSGWGSPPVREIVNTFGKKYLHVKSSDRWQGYSQNQSNRSGVGEITAGEKLTLSCYAYSTTSLTNYPPIGIHWTDGSSIISQSWPQYNLTTTPQKFVTTLTVPNGVSAFNIMVGNGSGTVSGVYEIWVADVKLEKGEKSTPWCPNSSDMLATTMGLNSTIEYDCSGFCNNGTRTGTFTWTSDTPKYTVSTAIEKGIITSTNSFITTADPIFSVAIWFKLKSGITYTSYTDLISFSSSSYSSQPFRLEICGSPVGTSIMWFRGPSGQSGGFAVKSDLSFDTWYHTVLVSEGNKQYSYYINGNKLGTYNGSANSWTPTGNVSLGENIAGVIYESDFRIYATALSADDVKSLYQNSAYIDSSGNVYGAVHSEV